MTEQGEHTALTAGWLALKKAAWTAARSHFELALSTGDLPEAHDGLGLALWWLNEIDAAHQQRTQAYMGYKARGSLPQAALMATWLGREQVFLSGNSSAMQGWFSRADRLLEEAGPSVERGWHELFRASMLAGNEDLETATFGVMQTAKTFKDTALEALALAFCGSARVALGRVSEGMTNLDEAMAAATNGELDNFAAISEIFCVMLSACELTGDWVRCEHWCQTAFEFAERHQCAFLGAYCRTTYGGLLAATGRWQAAETELNSAIRSFEAGHKALRIHAVLKLADLRVSQGRLHEAEILLQGYEDYGEAALPLARLYLSKGETDLARAVLEQSIQSQAAPTLHQAPILLLLCDVLLAQDNLNAAQKASQALHSLAGHSQSELLLAQADLTRGKILRRNNEAEAMACFQSAISRLKAHEQSLLASRARLEIARLLVDEDRAAAITWARAALASFDRLGAIQDANEASQVLRQLGVVARPGQRAFDTLTEREAEVLAQLGYGLTNREIADKLVISAKTVEHHVSQILAKLGARSRAEAAALASKGLSGQ